MEGKISYYRTIKNLPQYSTLSPRCELDKEMVKKRFTPKHKKKREKRKILNDFSSEQLYFQ